MRTWLKSLRGNLASTLWVASAAILFAVWMGSAAPAGAAAAPGKARASVLANVDCEAAKTDCTRLCSSVTAAASDFRIAVAKPPFGFADTGPVRRVLFSSPREAELRLQDPVLPSARPHRLRLRL